MIVVNDSNFAGTVLSGRTPVLVEFFTTTCQPCRALEPWLQKLEFDLQGQLKVVKVDAQRSPSLAQFYGAQMAPTLIVFKNGEPKQMIRGKPPTLQRLYDFVGPYL